MRTIDQIRWVVILLTAWIAISTISAQEIRGVTLREDGSPVPYVGVVLRTTSDSILIAGTYSDEDGRFLLTPSGDYPEGVPLSLYCSAIGYESRTLPVTLSDEPIRIVLREQSETLSETVVFGSRIKRSAAGYVAQVSDDLITKGVSLDKTLTFLPGITHNPTGYYLNGLPIAQFYIDDRKASVSELERLRPLVSDFCSLAKLKGYRTSSSGIRRRCVTCYTENVDQYVINYDLSVYKCTARDFDSAHCIDKIRRTDGHFLPNGLYYKFCLEQSPFINNRCLQCHVLPSCLQVTSCIQKKLEGFSPVCMKEHIEEEIHQYIHSELS